MKIQRNLGGAPLIDPELKKVIRHEVLFSNEEYKILRRKLKKTTCRSLNEYIRNALFEKTIKVEYQDPNMLAFLREMGNIGNNLNQIAKHFNQLNFSSDEIKKSVEIIMDVKKLNERILNYIIPTHSI